MDYFSIPDNYNIKKWKRILNRIAFVKNRIIACIFSIILLWCILSHLVFTTTPTLINTKSFGADPQFYLANSNKNDLTSSTWYNMKSQYEKIFQLNRLPTNAPVRAQLAFNFPYDSKSAIPKSIFQTWKVPNNHIKFPAEFRGPYLSWENKNSDYSHMLIPDNMLDEWVHTEFSNVPLVIEAWDSMPKIILKADFFRYLVIFSRGGVYSDMDTFCLKNIDSWAVFNEKYMSDKDIYIPGSKMKFGGDNRLDEEEEQLYLRGEDDDEKALFDRSDKIGMVLAIEADPDRSDWAEWYARRIQFVQWTVMAKRGHPLLRELIARIVEETLRKKELGTLKKVEGKDAGGDVMNWTGPGIYTDTAFDYMNNLFYEESKKSNSQNYAGTGYGVGSLSYNLGKKWKLKQRELTKDGLPLFTNLEEINWLSFTGLQRPAVVDDIMILPITSFSPGVGQMGSKTERDQLAFVKHLFEGSWKPESERM